MGDSAGLLYNEDSVRAALGYCQDLRKKQPHIKKLMARAEVCIGNYDVAEVYIKQYPEVLVI